MKRRFTTFAPASRPKPRSGLSLLEVIVSMLIMSIGVILLATLLPISILRTAQATQLTQAVFLRNNAEANLKSIPVILNGVSALDTTKTITTYPLFNYANGVGTVSYTNTVNGATYAVIDPLGYYKVVSSPNINVFWTSPINNAQTGSPIQVPRFFVNQLVSNAASAANLASLPDSWSDDPYILEGPVTYVPATAGSAPYLTVASSVTVPSLNVYNAYSINNNLDYPQYRMVIFDVTGKTAGIKPLTSISSPNLYWCDIDQASGSRLLTASSLPANFIPARVRVEVLQRRFTWLMTVRKQPTSIANWTVNADVVVFFNRSFNINDEASYTATFIEPGAGIAGGGGGFDQAAGVRNVDDDNNGVVDDGGELGWRGSDDNRTVTVSGIIPGQTLIKKGGFMFEPYNMQWYRILEIQFPSTTSAVLLLDQDVQYDAEVTVPAGNAVTLAGIFMKGVVDVYPLDQITGKN